MFHKKGSKKEKDKKKNRIIQKKKKRKQKHRKQPNAGCTKEKHSTHICAALTGSVALLRHRTAVKYKQAKRKKKNINESDSRRNLTHVWSHSRMSECDLNLCSETHTQNNNNKKKRNSVGNTITYIPKRKKETDNMKRCCRGSIRTKKKKEDYSLPAMYISYTPCRAFSDAAFQQPASKGEKKKTKKQQSVKRKTHISLKRKKKLNGISNKSTYIFWKKKKRSNGGKQIAGGTSRKKEKKPLLHSLFDLKQE